MAETDGGSVPTSRAATDGHAADRDWHRTGALRWFVLADDGRHILQREWLHADATTVEWRDVPFVDGARGRR